MKFERPQFQFMEPRSGRDLEEINSQVNELKVMPLAEAERILAERNYMAETIHIGKHFEWLPGNPFNIKNLHIIPKDRKPEHAPDFPNGDLTSGYTGHW